jgi:hypothetical protein
VRVAPRVVLNAEQRSKLMIYALGRSVSKRMVEKANIILRAAGGKLDQELAEALHIGRHTVVRWRMRFLKLGIAGRDKDAPRPGRTPRIDPEKIVRKRLKKSLPTSPLGARGPWRGRRGSVRPAFDGFGIRTA